MYLELAVALATWYNTFKAISRTNAVIQIIKIITIIVTGCSSIKY